MLFINYFLNGPYVPFSIYRIIVQTRLGVYTGIILAEVGEVTGPVLVVILLEMSKI